MKAWLLAGILLVNGGRAPNGQPQRTAIDEDFDAAVNKCAMALFGQQLQDNSIEPSEHGVAYARAYQRCRKAIGDLWEH